MIKHLMIGTFLAGAMASSAAAETVNILMEGVPDTEYVKTLLPEFKAKTGIDVNVEVVNYAEMHTKLVPQLVAPKGSYSAIVVDFYWVGEFTKAGWLSPLDERITADKIDTSVYVPKLMDLVGKVDGVTYMLPFYNYAMGLLYRKDLLDDAKNKADFKAANGFDLAPPKTWDEYLKQVAFFTKDGMHGVVNQGLRPDPIAMEWSNYLFANGDKYHDGSWKPTFNRGAAHSINMPPMSTNTDRSARRASHSTKPSTSWRRARPTATSPIISSAPPSMILPSLRSSARSKSCRFRAPTPRLARASMAPGVGPSRSRAPIPTPPGPSSNGSIA